MGYLWNGPVFMAGPKALLTKFGIHHRLESCGKSKCVCIGGLRWPDIVSSKLLLQVRKIMLTREESKVYVTT